MILDIGGPNSQMFQGFMMNSQGGGNPGGAMGQQNMGGMRPQGMDNTLGGYQPGKMGGMGGYDLLGGGKQNQGPSQN